MIERDEGTICFVCDKCSDYIDTETDNFAEANSIRKSKGWACIPEGDEWNHYCPECAE